MRSAIIEAHFLPCLHYMSKLLSYDHIYLEKKEHYKKRTYRNRCRVGSPNGILNLSVPLGKGKSSQCPMDEVTVAYQDDWARKFLRAIQSSYGKSAYFLHYFPELEDILLSKPTTLFDLNAGLIEWLIESLQMEVKISSTEQYQLPTELAEDIDDLRDQIQLKKSTTDSSFEEYPYPQVFEAKTGFLKDLSVIELLFTQGPQALFHLHNCIKPSN